MDTPTKFMAAIAAVIMLGIAVEAIAAVRSYFLRRRRRPTLTAGQQFMIRTAVVGGHVLQALMGLKKTGEYTEEFEY